MKANGKTIKEMGKEDNYGKMGLYMKAIGKITSLTAMVALFTQMGTFTLVNGNKIEPTERELTYQAVEPNIMDIGKMISKMETESNLGLIKQFIKDSTKMEKNTEKESLYGRMIALMKETSFKIIFMAKVDTSGKMEEYS
jgi:hypothetical protein